MEQTEVEAYNYQTKKQNSKTHSTISIDQPKFNKTRISTKPDILNITLFKINYVKKLNMFLAFGIPYSMW